MNHNSRRKLYANVQPNSIRLSSINGIGEQCNCICQGRGGPDCCGYINKEDQDVKDYGNLNGIDSNRSNNSKSLPPNKRGLLQGCDIVPGSYIVHLEPTTYNDTQQSCLTELSYNQVQQSESPRSDNEHKYVSNLTDLEYSRKCGTGNQLLSETSSATSSERGAVNNFNKNGLTPHGDAAEGQVVDSKGDPRITTRSTRSVAPPDYMNQTSQGPTKNIRTLSHTSTSSRRDQSEFSTGYMHKKTPISKHNRSHTVNGIMADNKGIEPTHSISDVRSDPFMNNNQLLTNNRSSIPPIKMNSNYESQYHSRDQSETATPDTRKYRTITRKTISQPPKSRKHRKLDAMDSARKISTTVERTLDNQGVTAPGGLPPAILPNSDDALMLQQSVASKCVRSDMSSVTLSNSNSTEKHASFKNGQSVPLASGYPTEGKTVYVSSSSGRVPTGTGTGAGSRGASGKGSNKPLIAKNQVNRNIPNQSRSRRDPRDSFSNESINRGQMNRSVFNHMFPSQLPNGHHKSTRPNSVAPDGSISSTRKNNIPTGLPLDNNNDINNNVPHGCPEYNGQVPSGRSRLEKLNARPSDRVSSNRGLRSSSYNHPQTSDVSPSLRINNGNGHRNIDTQGHQLDRSSEGSPRERENPGPDITGVSLDSDGVVTAVYTSGTDVNNDPQVVVDDGTFGAVVSSFTSKKETEGDQHLRSPDQVSDRVIRDVNHTFDYQSRPPRRTVSKKSDTTDKSLRRCEQGIKAPDIQTAAYKHPSAIATSEVSESHERVPFNYVTTQPTRYVNRPRSNTYPINQNSANNDIGNSIPPSVDNLSHQRVPSNYLIQSGASHPNQYVNQPGSKLSSVAKNGANHNTGSSVPPSITKTTYIRRPSSVEPKIPSSERSKSYSTPHSFNTKILGGKVNPENNNSNLNVESRNDNDEVGTGGNSTRSDNGIKTQGTTFYYNPDTENVYGYMPKQGVTSSEGHQNSLKSRRSVSSIQLQRYISPKSSTPVLTTVQGQTVVQSPDSMRRNLSSISATSATPSHLNGSDHLNLLQLSEFLNLPRRCPCPEAAHIPHTNYIPQESTFDRSAIYPPVFNRDMSGQYSIPGPNTTPADRSQGGHNRCRSAPYIQRATLQTPTIGGSPEGLYGGDNIRQGAIVKKPNSLNSASMSIVPGYSEYDNIHPSITRSNSVVGTSWPHYPQAMQKSLSPFNPNAYIDNRDSDPITARSVKKSKPILLEEPTDRGRTRIRSRGNSSTRSRTPKNESKLSQMSDPKGDTELPRHKKKKGSGENRDDEKKKKSHSKTNRTKGTSHISGKAYIDDGIGKGRSATFYGKGVGEGHHLKSGNLHIFFQNDHRHHPLEDGHFPKVKRSNKTSTRCQTSPQENLMIAWNTTYSGY